MQKKGKIILAVIALLVLCGLLYWVTRPQDKGLTATGTVEATRYDVTAKVPGYVRELTLQAGDTLNEGDLVCRIDREDLRAQVLAANAGLAAARARRRKRTKRLLISTAIASFMIRTRFPRNNSTRRARRPKWLSRR